MNRSTPRHLLHYVTRRLRLRRYLQDPGDGRQQPQIPAQASLWALLIGQILPQSSFPAVEALVRSSARRTLSIASPFCDDTLGYFTERLGWPLTILGLTIERLYRLRYLHRGNHRVHSSAQLLLHLWLSLSRPRASDSSRGPEEKQGAGIFCASGNAATVEQ